MSEGDLPGRVLWWPHEVRLCRGGAREGWGQWDNPLTVIQPAHLVSKCVLVACDLGAPVGKVGGGDDLHVVIVGVVSWRWAGSPYEARKQSLPFPPSSPSVPGTPVLFISLSGSKLPFRCDPARLSSPNSSLWMTCLMSTCSGCSREE